MKLLLFSCLVFTPMMFMGGSASSLSCAFEEPLLGPEAHYSESDYVFRAVISGDNTVRTEGILPSSSDFEITILEGFKGVEAGDKYGLTTINPWGPTLILNDEFIGLFDDEHITGGVFADQLCTTNPQIVRPEYGDQFVSYDALLTEKSADRYLQTTANIAAGVFSIISLISFSYIAFYRRKK